MEEGQQFTRGRRRVAIYKGCMRLKEEELILLGVFQVLIFLHSKAVQPNFLSYTAVFVDCTSVSTGKVIR